MVIARVLRYLGSFTALILVLLVLPLLPAKHAQAETISVIPPKFELYANPGDTLTEKLRIRNDSTTDATYETAVVDFTAQGDQGDVNLLEDPESPKSSFSLAKWVTLEPSKFTVPGGQEKVVSINIKVPRTGEPGSHFASVQVRLSGGDVPVNGGASVESRLNSLILLRVSGNLTESLNLESFHPDQSYYQHGPVDFVLKTKNDGNVHVAPTGTIVITDEFGKKVKELPLKVANVLPQAERSVRTTWDQTSMIGKYTATLQATYGNPPKNIVASSTFYVVPLSLVWGIIILLAIIVLAASQRKRLKKLLHSLTSD